MDNSYLMHDTCHNDSVSNVKLVAAEGLTELTLLSSCNVEELAEISHPLSNNNVVRYNQQC